MGQRSRYRGLFNYKGQTFTLYTHAKCKDSAFMNFINQLSEKLKLNEHRLFMEFDGSVDNYLIERR